jgi:hypothetical protein
MIHPIIDSGNVLDPCCTSRSTQITTGPVRTLIKFGLFPKGDLTRRRWTHAAASALWADAVNGRVAGCRLHGGYYRRVYYYALGAVCDMGGGLAWESLCHWRIARGSGRNYHTPCSDIKSQVWGSGCHPGNLVRHAMRQAGEELSLARRGVGVQNRKPAICLSPERCTTWESMLSPGPGYLASCQVEGGNSANGDDSCIGLCAGHSRRSDICGRDERPRVKEKALERSHFL